MLELLEKPISKLLKVPPEPDPPIGAPESVRVFRASPGFFRYRLLGWGLKQASTAVGLVVGLAFLRFLPEAVHDDEWYGWMGIVELLGVAFYFAQLPFTFLLVSLDYRYRWYVVTDRSLRIREGLWKVQERTMTFSNLQNLSIRQGPLQRLFKIADLEVRTAGGGSKHGDEWQEKSDNLHVGYFRGLDNAEKIRDTILARLRRVRAAGLGDPDEDAGALASDEAPPAPSPGGAGVVPTPGDAGHDVLAAAREVLDEVRALRQAVRP
jgi:membrane protein YdbS with pleckstrin-like domain